MKFVNLNSYNFCYSTSFILNFYSTLGVKEMNQIPNFSDNLTVMIYNIIPMVDEMLLASVRCGVNNRGNEQVYINMND